MAGSISEAMRLAQQSALTAGVKYGRTYGVTELSNVFDREESYFRNGFKTELKPNSARYNRWKLNAVGHERKGHLYNRFARILADKQNVRQLSNDSWNHDMLCNAPPDVADYIGAYVGGHTGNGTEAKAPGMGGFSSAAVGVILNAQQEAFVRRFKAELPPGYRIVSIRRA